MELVIDVGNTDLVWAIFQDKGIFLEGRTPTQNHPDEISILKYFREQMMEQDVSGYHIRAGIIGCVVPQKLSMVSAACMALLEKEPIIAGPELYQSLPLKIDKPYEIGADLVANAFHAFDRFKQACLIIDFGTALTFTAVDDKGHIAGVAIAPGLKTAVASLQLNTAQLPEVPLVFPENVLGKDTPHAIAAGVLIGYEGLILHLMEQFKKSLGEKTKVIATGGLAHIIPSIADATDLMSTSFTLEGFHRMLLHTLSTQNA